MSEEKFFQEAGGQSVVKTTIVTKYFGAWSKVIIPSVKRNFRSSKKLVYMDLFCGPGKFQDGTKSTPLIIIERAIQDNDLRNMLVTVFNDKNLDYVKTLDDYISNIPGTDTLRYKPQIINEEVGESFAEMFEKMQVAPTLLFVDPWGYKGLSLRLIGSVLKDWGCDCIFFFNYNRINPGIDNPFVQDHMISFFGKDRFDSLKTKLDGLNSDDREPTIIEEISQALKYYGRYVIPFCFKDENGTRTSHYLIFVSKSPVGYGIMKEIMASESSRSTQGIPSFEYCPASPQQELLFLYSRPLDALGDMLLNQFKGRTLSMQAIYEQHNIDTPYIKSNYKEILVNLEKQGKIIADPPAEKRQKRNGKPTFGDKVTVTFPD